MFRNRDIKATRQQYTNLHNLPHSNWSNIKTIPIRGFASTGRPARQSRFTVIDNILWNRAFVSFSFTSYVVSFVRCYLPCRRRPCPNFLGRSQFSLGPRCRCEWEGTEPDLKLRLRYLYHPVNAQQNRWSSPPQAPLDRKRGRPYFAHVDAATQSRVSTRGGLRLCGAPGWNLERGPIVAYAENFHGSFIQWQYRGHLFVVCGLCFVTFWRHIHISKPTFWRSLLT